MNTAITMPSMHIDKRYVVPLLALVASVVILVVNQFSTERIKQKHRRNGGELGTNGGPGMTRTSDLYFIRVAL